MSDQMLDRVPPVGKRAAPAHSLRLRLPLVMSALIAMVLTTFLWVAFRQVESALLEAGGARAQGAADQLANLLTLQTRQRIGDIERAARSTAIEAYLQHPDENTEAAARQRLAALTTAGQPPVEIWDDHGRRLLTVTGPAPANATAAAGAQAQVPVTAPPAGPGVTAFQVSNNIVFWDAVGEVREAPPEGQPPSPGAERLGWVISRRVLSSASASDVLGRLVGRGAVIKIGNQSGGVWTDLSKVTPPPRIDASRNGVSDYRADDGQRRVGANTPIAGTPWTTWVEFPRDLVVAPARIFLTRMLIFGLCFVAAAAVLAHALSARITTPLRVLTDAAERIAAGKSVERVAIARRDEIGRLGVAFNTMATQVHGVQRELEERVERRTASLAETSALLEQRLAELNATRQELDQFFGLSVDLMCIAGADGRFRRVNAAWQATLGWTPDELTSRPFIDFVHPDDRAATERETAKLAAGGMTVSFENRYKCKDGSYRWLSWSSASSPQLGLLYAAARDVTEQKQRAADQQQHAADLAALNSELEAFSYSVSHDLRAPLRHIMGFSSLLQRSAQERFTENDRRYADTIVAAAARMGRLIDDLLSFSRMGRAELHCQRIRLSDVVADAQREVAGAVSTPVTWNIHPLPEVHADPSLLRLAFVNLLSNAAKYTAGRPDASIEVGVDGVANGEAVVFVRDNGVGFDMQYVHKLFGVFQRLHSSDEFEGTGIGLANVRRIVHRHGGRVWAEGAINRGATFFVALPTTAEGGHS
jgi:PAS domain S-box-containing protein